MARRLIGLGAHRDRGGDAPAGLAIDHPPGDRGAGLQGDRDVGERPAAEARHADRAGDPRAGPGPHPVAALGESGHLEAAGGVRGRGPLAEERVAVDGDGGAGHRLAAVGDLAGDRDPTGDHEPH
jgi:hypothetical protein